MRLLRHLFAIMLLPFLVTIVVPVFIVFPLKTRGIGWGPPAPLGLVSALIGGVLIGAGLLLIYRTVSLFATEGDGTLAPWDPPRRLVVRGPYRYVRNPMISGVLAVLLGEAIFLGSVPLLAWFLAFFALNAILMPLIEEPMLERRFGSDYVVYRQNVPRWIPRPRPWTTGQRPQGRR